MTSPVTHRIQTFKPRRRQLSPTRQVLLERLMPLWGLPIEGPPFDSVETFGRVAPLVVDIGIGWGDALTTSAVDEPAIDVIGADIHTPGIAATLHRIESLDLTNVRLVHGDALRFLDRVPAGSLQGIRVYFPDPWHKARHRRRRLASAANIERFVELLSVGGTLHIATDVADYADQVVRLCLAQPELIGGPIARPADRPVTKYERKGIDAGRAPIDLMYTRLADLNASLRSG